MFSCHNFILFLFHSCNKILLDFCFAYEVFLFLFFSFCDLDLELGLLMFLSWFRKPYRLGCFVPITTTPRFLRLNLSLFKRIIVLIKTFNPLTWWAQHKQQFLNIGIFAHEMMCIMALQIGWSLFEMLVLDWELGWTNSNHEKLAKWS